MREVDKIERNKEVGPSAGVLVAVKDNICSADMQTTPGSRVSERYRLPFNATTMRKLRESGSIIVGKTNLDEFGIGSTTEASPCQNKSLVDKVSVDKRRKIRVSKMVGLAKGK
ncbi:hypothetical protein RHGRI_013896 [Rhododendron griersonianum]|uniref:Amidase domain-containing protein n=1 Tax=Rhododendron griersonianum TaxID=479676 RepID=A0AAV6K7F3_9ERIC|nr:hypothetical protein RHGRI_013896 [Rhododendron griersonianum]